MCLSTLSLDHFSISELNISISELNQTFESINTTNQDYLSSSQIPVIVGFRPPKENVPQPKFRYLKTIKRDNKGAVSLVLPNIAVYNHRSIWATKNK